MKINTSAKILASSALMFCLSAVAQSNPSTPPPPPGYPGAAVEASAPEGNYVLEINETVFTHRGKKEAATLAAVLDALRDIYKHANLVVSPRVERSVMIQDLKLRTDNLGDALEAVRIASGEAFQWRLASSHGGPITDPASGMYVITPPEEPAGERQVQAFNLTPYLQSAGITKPDEVRSALEDIKRMIAEAINSLKGGADPRTDFQFHPGANLLVVIGSRETLPVATTIISALQGSRPLGMMPQPMSAPAPQPLQGIRPPLPERPLRQPVETPHQ